MEKRITCKKFRHKTAKSVLLSALIVVFICGCGKNTAEYINTDVVQSTEFEEETQQTLEQEMVETETIAEICVYICGCIKQPGVYFLESGSRVCDIFEDAGGFTEEAAADYWNQARILSDGEMIYVPTKEEAKEQALPDMSQMSGMSEEDAEEEKININTASKEELMEIPGVGESRAESIIAYRQEQGGFSDISDIKNVSGIKDGMFNKIKEYIVVN